MAFGGAKKVYIATMEVWDEESRQRVLRHQRMRSGKGFSTLECPIGLSKAAIGEVDTVLLECMSNLVANEMFSPAGLQDATHLCEDVLCGVKRLTQQAKHVVIVTNQVFSDGVVYDEATERYKEVLAKINAALAAQADEVVEVVCGIPVVLKQIGE